MLRAYRKDYFPMSDPQYAIKKWLAEKVAPHGKLSELSEATGIAIDKLSRSKELDSPDPKKRRRLQLPEIEAIARFFNELPPGFEDMVSWLRRDRDPAEPDEIAEHTVPVVGYVGAGAEAHFYALSDGELDRVPAPDGATPETVAVEIRGESLGPLFERWLIHYDEVRSPITPDLHGQLCVVGLANDKVLVKKVRPARSKAQGLYDLLSNNEDPMPDQVIVWAAKVKSMVPR
jgi:hypothetical protein